MTLLSDFDKNKQENQENNVKFSEKFEGFSKDLDNMKKTIEKDMVQGYEEKLHVWEEKIKKQNQELWEESMKYIKTDFKEIGCFLLKFFKVVGDNFR